MKTKVLPWVKQLLNPAVAYLSKNHSASETKIIDLQLGQVDTHKEFLRQAHLTFNFVFFVMLVFASISGYGVYLMLLGKVSTFIVTTTVGTASGVVACYFKLLEKANNRLL
jgi:hypothetical protein